MPTQPTADALRAHYRRFLDPTRTLLTGHSHQAWPDVARDGVLRCFDDAARHVDDKWALASEAADAVRRACAAQFGGTPPQYALGSNTHELVYRFLSALDLDARPHLVSTSGEFHSMTRQLTRLLETGVQISWVDASPVETLSERVAAEVRENTAAVLLSTVLFESAAIVPHLEAACHAAHAVGAEVLLDAYHQFNVVPFVNPDPGAFVVSGGYKYAQWGEGACFMRVPADTTLRPVFTGWFADFGSLATLRMGVGYGATPADRFAGSTYDPTSHYRARAVIDFFAEHGLSVEVLRGINRTQTEHLATAFAARGFEVVVPDAERRGGFVSLRLPDATARAKSLRALGVFVDARRSFLRFGPAPYTTEDEMDRAIELLGAPPSS